MTRRELSYIIKNRLEKAGIEAADFEATELLCHILGSSKAQLLSDGCEPVSDVELEALEKLISRRKSGYPLQYLIGNWEFYGRSFAVGEGVLIPRPDTETLCEEVIRFIGKKPLCVVDLCSGSGCIAVTIAKECPNSRVYAVEKSQAAFGYLQKNIQSNASEVTAFCLDAAEREALEAIPACDVVVSNPPYLTKQDMERLQKEVQFEPSMALYGDTDGLFFYRTLTKLWKEKLKSGGRVFYEIGMGQEQDVRQILLENNFHSVCETPDLCGIIRVISGSV